MRIDIDRDGFVGSTFEEVETKCDVGETCSKGACVGSGSPEDYQFGDDASWLNMLVLAEDDPTTPDIDEGDCCCFSHWWPALCCWVSGH